MRILRVHLALAMCVVGVGCRHVEGSPIVTAYHRAGGGDIDRSTVAGIGSFLSSHDQLRTELTPLCEKRRATAPGDWSTTDEGKVCDANAQANFFGKNAVKSDGKAF
ncbi:hypothetical protein [Acidisarcina polymorpha]|uniref:hypothetical protein n=1 Tax=Acidisarcina polymorpha TaxID=2211140 RepID=UPI000DEFDF2B|nr:hypothetical protein [Acidisarcina polymorpha]